MVTHYEENDLLHNSNGEHQCCYGSIIAANNASDGHDIFAEERNSLLSKDVDDHAFTKEAGWKNNPQSPPLTKKDDVNVLRDEISGMVNLAAPVMLTYFLEMLPGIVTLIQVGREMANDTNDSGDDDDERKLRLDAASLAVMFTNVVALSPAYGES